jgi:uncharacterized protein YjbI with pentapeptide repeats
MTDPTPLDAAERAFLRGRPPRDPSGRRVPWRLEDRIVTDEEWEDEPFEIEDLTLARVTFERFSWQTQGTFRKCRLEGVSFTECSLAGLRFEDVVFDHCTITGLEVARVAFVRCTFKESTLAGVSAVHAKLERCAWSRGEASRWSLDDCEIVETTFEDTRLAEVQASKCTLGISIVRGALLSADLTMCKGKALEMDGASVKGVRARGLELDRLSLWGAVGGQLALTQCKLGELSLSGCDGRTTLSLVACPVKTLKIDACPSLQSLMVRSSEVGAVHVSDSTLFDATFDAVTVSGDASIESSSLRGLFFKGGSWPRLHVTDVELWNYLAVEGTHFGALKLERVAEREPVRRRLEGDTYDPGSMTWRAGDGS